MKLCSPNRHCTQVDCKSEVHTPHIVTSRFTISSKEDYTLMYYLPRLARKLMYLYHTKVIKRN